MPLASDQGSAAGTSTILGGILAGRATIGPASGGVVSSDRAVQGNYGSIGGQAGYPADFVLGLSVESLNGVRVEEYKAKGSTAVLFFQRDILPADIREKAAEVRRLFRLQPGQHRFALPYSPMRGSDDELTVNSRSMLQILQAFAAVTYRGQWFRVDDSDWLTKRAFSAVMFFFTLADTGTPERLPLVTIPAQ